MEQMLFNGIIMEIAIKFGILKKYDFHDYIEIIAQLLIDNSNILLKS